MTSPFFYLPGDGRGGLRIIRSNLPAQCYKSSANIPPGHLDAYAEADELKGQAKKRRIVPAKNRKASRTDGFLHVVPVPSFVRSCKSTLLIFLKRSESRRVVLLSLYNNFRAPKSQREAPILPTWSQASQGLHASSIRSAPAVDRLFRVADDDEPSAGPRR